MVGIAAQDGQIYWIGTCPDDSVAHHYQRNQ
jgi:hypothetical protein